MVLPSQVSVAAVLKFNGGFRVCIEKFKLNLNLMSRSDGSKDYSSSSCDLLDRLTGHAGWPRTRDLEAASSSRVAAAGPGHAVAPAAAVPRTRDSESDAARGGRGRGNPRPRAGGCRALPVGRPGPGPMLHHERDII